MSMDRVLSLGAGVQSSTLLLMAVHGELPLAAAVFADTGWEPQAVYTWLGTLETEAARAGIPVYRVTSGNLREDAIGRHSSVWMPLFVLNKAGGEGQLKRQCTVNYKVRPIRRQLRALGYGPRNRVAQVLGISFDEVGRMRDSDAAWVRNEYPLVDRRMRRSDCVLWLERHGYPVPMKSACIGCPYHGNADWRDMKLNRPEEWADATAFDEAIRYKRDGHNFQGQVFLHAKRIPLAEVDLRNQRDHGQLDLFGEECSGVCGV